MTANGKDHDPPNLPLLIRLLKMTTSSNDAEALVAIRKANEQLAKFGGDWEPLLLGKVTVIADPFAHEAPLQPSTEPKRAPPPPPRPQPKPTPRPAAPPPPPKPQPSPLLEPQFGKTQSGVWCVKLDPRDKRAISGSVVVVRKRGGAAKTVILDKLEAQLFGLDWFTFKTHATKPLGNLGDLA